MLIPTSDRVIISKTEREEKTKSGIIIASSVSEQSIKGNFNTGKIVSISPELQKDNEIKIGDNVMYAIGSGISFDYNGKEHLIMRIGEIFMIDRDEQ